jgi:hypothetical protein
MARWVGACGALRRPLVEALPACVLMPGKVHSDDTPMPVLAPGNGQTKTGHLWGYVRRASFWFDGSMVCLHARSAGPASTDAPGQFQRCPPG